MYQCINGGEFGHGFASAGMTAGLGDAIFAKGAEGWERVKNAVKAAIVGGTMSRLTGGKFQNGAVTGAFSRLLNDEASPYPKRGKPTTDFEEAVDDQIQRVRETKRFHGNPLDSRSEYKNSEAGGYIYFEDGKYVPSGTNIVSQGIIGNTELGNGAGAGNAGSYPQYPITKANIPVVASIRTIDAPLSAFTVDSHAQANIRGQWKAYEGKNYLITSDNYVLRINPSVTNLQTNIGSGWSVSIIPD